VTGEEIKERPTDLQKHQQSLAEQLDELTKKLKQLYEESEQKRRSS